MLRNWQFQRLQGKLSDIELLRAYTAEWDVIHRQSQILKLPFTVRRFFVKPHHRVQDSKSKNLTYIGHTVCSLHLSIESAGAFFGLAPNATLYRL